MKRIFRKIMIVKVKHSRSRKRRKALEKTEENYLKMARLMSHEYPAGTSPHYISYQMQRSKATDQTSL